MKFIYFGLLLILVHCSTVEKVRRTDFSEKEERLIFNKAISTSDPNVRIDICGNPIHFDKYCNKKIQCNKRNKLAKYGWEIDHIKPSKREGGNEFKNLQPLQWLVNKRKGKKWPITPKEYCSKKN